MMTPNGLASSLVDIPRRMKRAIMVTVDATALPLLLWVAFALRFNTFYVELSFSVLYLASPLIALPILYVLGFYRSVVRYLGSEAAWSILMGTSLTIISMAAMATLFDIAVPRSVFLIFWMLAVLYLGGSRFLARRLLFTLLGERGLNQEAVAIFGAGSAGAQLITALLSSREFRPVLVADDDRSKIGSLLCGIPVVARSALAKAIKEKRVTTVLLAIPGQRRAKRFELIRWLEGLSVHVQTVPSFSEIASGRARVDDIQEVSIEDLLGRDAVPPEQLLLDRCIRNKQVLVTGAGGSIGSELCRQIIALRPSCLVLLDQSELALYAIERELQRTIAAAGLNITLASMLGSVVTRGHVQRLCERYDINTVYHAAAYKHVPIVEANPLAGIRNNVFGTMEAAVGAESAGVEHFILVSTDKAVRPTNVMGATKRFAELVLQAMNNRGSSTIFSMVRFGNVLGSSGSVVPLFKDQIMAGGPVTVTHPDVIRYFMTIPEAAQLVIQAGAMARGGEVFLLDMGDPVKIIDLARTMIHLMGLTVRDEDHPDGEIDIIYTGLRPGEKLYEELLIGDESEPTEHQMIMRAQEEMLTWPEVSAALDMFREALERSDGAAIRALLQQYVSGFQPGKVA